MSNKEVMWDDKFGLINKPYVAELDFNELDKRLEETDRLMTIKDEFRNKVIDGVGKDAEIITNEKGGKQSKAPMAMHLVDPRYLREVFKNKAEELEYLDEGGSTQVNPKNMDIYSCYRAIESIADYMLSNIDFDLAIAMDVLSGSSELNQVINIAKTLQYGADKYASNNWRLIPEEEHINHALIHLIAHLAGDTQDDHINHALCRLMMARATEKSEGFAYGAYVEKAS